MRDYGTGSWAGGDPDCDHKQDTRHQQQGANSQRQGRTNAEDQRNENFRDVCGKCGAARTDQQLGLEPTPEAYVARMVEVFREVRRVLRRDGTCWLNLGDSYCTTAPGTGMAGNSATSTLIRNARLDAQDAERAKNVRPATPDGLKPKDLVGIPWRVAFALQQPYYAGTIKDERDRIWLAAMVEAEGCMFIHKRKAGQLNGQGYERKNDSFGAGLEVSSTDRVIVERCMAIAGIGSICEQTPEQNERRKQTIYRWNVRSNECRDIIRELYPHFYAKQHEARLLLACPSSGANAEKAHESLKAIHQGGTPMIDFAPPASMFEEGWYVRAEVIWAKKNCMPESVTDRPTKSHEQVFLLTRSPRYYFDQEAIREPHTPDGRIKTIHAHAVDNSHENYANMGTDQERWPNSGRNARSVWTIATQPYAEAHFATFPEELPRRCIAAGTSEHGCCPVCGAPWERIIEVESSWRSRAENGAIRGNLAPEGLVGAGTQRAVHGSGVSHDLDSRSRKELGWRPTCGCGEWAEEFARHSLPPIPCTVLDPFMGSGAVALVARKLGRRSIGIELSPQYAELAARRLGQQSLFASEPDQEPSPAPAGQGVHLDD